MKIVVCVKHVPDAAGDRTFRPDFTTDRDAATGLLSELDEYAVEEALKIKESLGTGEVIVLTMGPAGAADAIKKSLQMGADSGVHVCDDALAGSDSLATSAVLAAAISKIAEDAAVDVVLTGMASTDGGMSVVPSMLAERLQWPQATFASELTVGEGSLTMRRDGDTATEVITSPLPAVVAVTDQINTPRFPSFKGIMSAKKKPVTTYSLGDLGLEPSTVGLAASMSPVTEATARPAREQGLMVTDDGQGGEVVAHYLSIHRAI
ncbi:paired box protein Pax-4 [Platysternon megacephalum]|uniref:Electron transfer flavoprotein subunit beta n=1 Tax=Platysternon megacephalum TaxID=55544 RepID=A0A4D9DJU5_9SAUR|nr:paired box protein Pax-4 [Platysternon megacephalum]